MTKSDMTQLGVGVTCQRPLPSQEGLTAVQIADKLYDPHSKKKVKELLSSGGEMASDNGVSGSRTSQVTCHMSEVG